MLLSNKTYSEQAINDVSGDFQPQLQSELAEQLFAVQPDGVTDNK